MADAGAFASRILLVLAAGLVVWLAVSAAARRAPLVPGIGPPRFPDLLRACLRGVAVLVFATGLYRFTTTVLDGRAHVSVLAWGTFLAALLVWTIGNLGMIVHEERVLRRRAPWQRAGMLLGTLVLVAGGFLGHRITSAALAFPPADVCVVIPFPLDGTWTVATPTTGGGAASREVVLVAVDPDPALRRLHVPTAAGLREGPDGLALTMADGIEVVFPGMALVASPSGGRPGAGELPVSRIVDVAVPGSTRGIVRVLARRASGDPDHRLPMRFDEVARQRAFRWTAERAAALLRGDRVRRSGVEGR